MNEVVREGVDNVIGKVRKTSASNDYLNALAIFFVSLYEVFFCKKPTCKMYIFEKNSIERKGLRIPTLYPDPSKKYGYIKANFAKISGHTPSLWVASCHGKDIRGM